MELGKAGVEGSLTYAQMSLQNNAHLAKWGRIKEGSGKGNPKTEPLPSRPEPLPTASL